MNGLFDPSVVELIKAQEKNPLEWLQRFKWLMGHPGEALKLAREQLVAVSPERVMPEGRTPDYVAIEAAAHKYRQQLLSRFVDCLSDDECPNEIKSILPVFRDEARANGCADSVPILRLIRYGVHLPYHLRSDAPLLGACVDEFKFLQNWTFDDVVTEIGNKKRDLLVVGGPWLLADSTGKTNSDQLEMLADRGKMLKLDNKIKLVRGSAALVAILCQSHEILTGERFPKDGYWARTNTVLASGDRLRVRRNSDGALLCDDWVWGGDARDSLGCLAPGVMTLGH
ncbi:MAG: hypothetical protein A2261_04305 [Candidatus Magasanikbacteria bacterium RIFOXYA2_FULL_44_8]|uniref:Uncharacterized protein n=1 Tax=Candidatus Magasanikbacteria bacterium RIFOXYA2_FULL_44_8 TaxID=1798696 RepID=A0A1F6NKG1_9BACT|nr:MAG: hypothetical protein A2261_04305 [Candidatus Magasanikbacteria bacterium RIFOXYA2_FULL_44_8]